MTNKRNDGRKTLTKNRANHPQNPPSDGADPTTTKQDNYTCVYRVTLASVAGRLSLAACLVMPLRPILTL